MNRVNQHFKMKGKDHPNFWISPANGRRKKGKKTFIIFVYFNTHANIAAVALLEEIM